jgi:hypothetical protein
MWVVVVVVVVVVIILDAQSNVRVICHSSLCPQRGIVTNEQTFARRRRRLWLKIHVVSNVTCRRKKTWDVAARKRGTSMRNMSSIPSQAHINQQTTSISAIVVVVATSSGSHSSDYC